MFKREDYSQVTIIVALRENIFDTVITENHWSLKTNLQSEWGGGFEKHVKNIELKLWREGLESCLNFELLVRVHRRECQCLNRQINWLISTVTTKIFNDPGKINWNYSFRKKNEIILNIKWKKRELAQIIKRLRYHMDLNLIHIHTKIQYYFK